MALFKKEYRRQPWEKALWELNATFTLAYRGREYSKSMEWGRGSLCVVDTVTAFPTKDAHTLIPRICEDVTLHGKRDFADMIKVRDLETG